MLARYRSLTWNPAIGRSVAKQLGSYDVTHIYGLYDLIGPGVASTCRRMAALCCRTDGHVPADHAKPLDEAAVSRHTRWPGLSEARAA